MNSGISGDVFFSFGGTQELDISALNKIDRDGFIRELRAFQAVEDKPLILKGMILNWHIPFLADLYPESYFPIRETFHAEQCTITRSCTSRIFR